MIVCVQMPVNHAQYAITLNTSLFSHFVCPHRKNVPKLTSTLSSFEHTGKCCSATRKLYRYVNVDVHCENGTMITISHLAGTATDCGCSPVS